MELLIQSLGYGFIALVIFGVAFVFFKILISAFVALKDNDD